MYIGRKLSDFESSTSNSTRASIEEHRIAFSVDCVIFGYGEEKLKILLVECNLPSCYGNWALLGDFIRNDENLDFAAHRILKDYTQLESIYLEQVETFGAKGRYPLERVITTAYYSLMKVECFDDMFTDGLRVQWFAIDDLPEMAFDHAKILNSCHNRLKKSLAERPIGFELLPKKFTLGQLRKLYEIVLEIKIDKRNFRRKLRSLNLLVDTETLQSDVSHRPAKLFSFDFKRYHQQMTEGFHFEL